MENNNNIEQDVLEVEGKKKVSVTGIITAVIIVVILAAFGGIVYYNNVIVPDKKIDKQIGYTPEDYITPGQVDGFTYEITQEMFDEYVSEYNSWYETVNRGAKDTDEVEFNYTGKVNGEIDDNISEKNAVITVGDDIEGVYQVFSKAMVGLKKGDTTEVTVSGDVASILSENGTTYTEDVVFELKVKAVSELVVEELSDEWVVENLMEDYGFESLDDFYTGIEESLMDAAEIEVWRQAVNASKMSSWPESLYLEVYEEIWMDANYNADLFGMKTEDYLYTVEGYTDQTLEDYYLSEVQAELLMWYLIKKWDLKATEDEVEEEFEYYAWEIGYDSVEEMKQDYTYEEIEENVLLEKVCEHIAENSNIIKSYTIPSH